MAEKMRKLTFWENYYSPMKRIKDRGERAAYALKVLEYAFDDIEPELNDMEAMSFDSIAPLIYVDMHGNKGGRPTGTGSSQARKTASKTGIKTGSKTTEETTLYEEKRMEDEGDSSLKKNPRSSDAPGVAAAAGAAPPVAKTPGLHCVMDGCDGYGKFDPKTGMFRCRECGAEFAAEEAS